ncbi:MAG: aminodeoxychorismate synthase component I [Proteobacteria bacterium]|nr:aminodeoxychorismate synthase component I [Pseudomonadota bacterium]
MLRSPFVLIDDARPGQESLRRYRQPIEVVEAREPQDVPGALIRLQQALHDGRHAAGYFSYELGYLLESKLVPLLPAERSLPLLWFGIFEAVEVLKDADAGRGLREAVNGRAYAGALTHDWNQEDYASRYARVHDYIEAGDIYQANLSFRSRFCFLGDPLALYLELRKRSAAAHGAFLDDGTRQILSLSPELFFELSADRSVVAKPMKGTAPRGDDALLDAAARRALAESAKDRAENLMIVDLLRNDVGRIAEVGSVAVENLFCVETYPTLHTMTSTVRALVRPGVGVADILRALFPCGSVTGAPKIRAMEVIRELEASPRGAYCGAIGYFAPDGSARFNVAIRTLTIDGRQGELGIGGGIVQDSSVAGEYAECLLKARYYESARRPLELIETLRWSRADGFVRLELHLARMARSAKAFGVPFEEKLALDALDRAIGADSHHKECSSLRVRLTLSDAGQFLGVAAPFEETGATWRYAVSRLRVASSDTLNRHKVSWREFYENELTHLTELTGCDEVLFLNERDEVAEAARANVFARIGSTLVTPPLSAGILDGCLRRELLQDGRCEERVLTLADLDNAEAVYLGNSLRGLVPAVPLTAALVVSD